MKKHTMTAILIALSTLAFSQTQKDVCLKIGGCYFINCQRTIAFGEYSILTVSGNDTTGRMVNFGIYNSGGTLDASLKDGKFTGAQASSYEVKKIAHGFTVSDKRSGRAVLKVANNYNETKKRNEMHVWADFYLPDKNRFQCTPDTSNLPLLDMMKGSTFENVGTAIQL